MAKKNSTKTATKEAIQNAVPRIQTYTAWKGIDIQNIPIDIAGPTTSPTPEDWQGKAQSDANAQTLAIQNNLKTMPNGTLATRYEAVKLKDAPDNCFLTGVSFNHDEYVYCATVNLAGYHGLWRFKLPNGTWEEIKMNDINPSTEGIKRVEIKSMLVFQAKFIVLTQVTIGDKTYGEMYDGDLDTITVNGVTNAVHVPDPTESLKVDLHGIGSGSVSRLRFTYTYCNKYGTTVGLPGEKTITVGTDTSPVEFQSSKYIQLSNTKPVPTNKGITGVDVYVTENEAQKYAFIGHVNIEPNQTNWSFAWLGAMMDLSEWTMHSLGIPTQNTTDGVDACYMDNYDGRLYFYGGSRPYRLYVGGNPGNELTVSTGMGGAFVDIEPGSGQEIRKVLKFKTYNGATVVTLLTYHPNTSKSSRYNLLETDIALTNENQAKGYSYEKVDSVLGVSSYYGADTFIDGLYAVNRYGLAFTTKQQENRNDLRIQYCSDPIRPIFRSVLGYQVNESRLLCVNDIVYVCLAKTPDQNQLTTDLEKILFCYDTTAKCWYTHTLSNVDNIRHLIQIDSSKHTEGVGIISDKAVYLLPTTGDDFNNYYYQDGTDWKPKPGFPNTEVFMETHELALRTPVTNMFYCNQLEVNFDYICSPTGLDIWVEGYDIYGRHFKVIKHASELKLERQTTYYLRVDRYVKSFRLFIKGKAHCRLTHVNVKCFQQSASIGNAYGFDTWHEQRKQHGQENLYHHELQDYNDLKEIILT